jgi:monofunctional biosynthetic peptidoglycan transglycosylase
MSGEQDRNGGTAGRVNKTPARGAGTPKGKSGTGTGSGTQAKPATVKRAGTRPASKRAPAKRPRTRREKARRAKTKRVAASRGGRISRYLNRLFRWVWRLAVVAIMVPVILVPLFKFVAPVSTLMIWQTVRYGSVDRRWVPLEDIAPTLAAAVLMSEDGKFCAHSGVDWEELNRVLENTNGRRRGASTISMQAVKNVFLWQSRSVVRKALEIPLAMFADTIWGKRRMMEIYLNIVEWGPGVFGAEAAALHHFGVSANRLSAAQSALLAVTLPNPALRDPAHPSPRLQSLARTAEARARTSGAYINCLR